MGIGDGATAALRGGPGDPYRGPGATRAPGEAIGRWAALNGMKQDLRPRTGKNAPDEAERERIALLDRVLAVLLKVGITQADVADSLGESESTITHLRTNLTHYS